MLKLFVNIYSLTVSDAKYCTRSDNSSSQLDLQVLEDSFKAMY